MTKPYPAGHRPPEHQENQVVYTGAVHPGRPARRELAQLAISKVSVGASDNNAYLLACPATGEAVLIDAADEPVELRNLVALQRLRYIVTTHRHADHWRALATLVAHTGAIAVAHPADAPALPIPISTLVVDNDELCFGEVSLRIIHLAGHTPGSIALAYHDPQGSAHIWTGDSLFPGGPGKTATQQISALS